MGFLLLNDPKPAHRTLEGKRGASVELLHRHGCNACPLNKAPRTTPKMEPFGAKAPRVYMLGDAATFADDRQGRALSGKGGKRILDFMPDKLREHVRWNNTVRTAPFADYRKSYESIDSRVASEVATECCRPSIIKDIEASQPEAIFGFGNTVITWMIGQVGGWRKWSGRRIPVTIGTHTCWFYPFHHPGDAIAERRWEPWDKEKAGGDEEFTFIVHLKKAFREVLDGLPEPVIETREAALADLELITGNEPGDLDRALAIMTRAARDKLVGFDYETNRLRPYNDGSKILTFAFGFKDAAVAIALDHKQAGWSKKERNTLWLAFITLMTERRNIFAAQNAAFEIEWSGVMIGEDTVRADTPDMEKLWDDTASMGFIIDERMKKGRPDCHSLQFMCIEAFGLDLKGLSALDASKLDDEPVEQVLRYNAMDAKYHRRLYVHCRTRLEADGLWGVYLSHMERIPTAVLSQMEGIPISRKQNAAYLAEYLPVMENSLAAINEVAEVQRYNRDTKEPFRPAAPGDTLKLFTKYFNRKLASGDEAALAKLDLPIVKHIMAYRKAAKIVSTYLLPVTTADRNPDTSLFDDNRLHPILNTIRTETWRTSSEDPNVQNWPKRKGDSKKVRSQVRGGSGEYIVSFDFGQIQARNVAMESKDEKLVKSFWDRTDIHADWVWHIAKVHPPWIKEGMPALRASAASKVHEEAALFKVYRNRAKNEFVFPSFFGARAKTLSTHLKIDDLGVCEQLSEKFGEEFPDVKGWQDGLHVFYQKHGYVTGLTGFRRRAPISPNQLINAPIQADESEIVMTAMTNLSKRGLQAAMEIHDDLTFVWHGDDVQRNAEIVVQEMTRVNFDWINTPLLVEMSIGRNWAKQIEVGAFESDKDRKDDGAVIGKWRAKMKELEEG